MILDTIRGWEDRIQGALRASTFPLIRHETPVFFLAEILSLKVTPTAFPYPSHRHRYQVQAPPDRTLSAMQAVAASRH